MENSADQQLNKADDKPATETKKELEEAEEKLKEAEEKLKEAETKLKEAETKLENAKEEFKQVKRQLEDAPNDEDLKLEKVLALRGVETAQSGAESAQEFVNFCRRRAISISVGLTPGGTSVDRLATLFENFALDFKGAMMDTVGQKEGIVSIRMWAGGEVKRRLCSPANLHQTVKSAFAMTSDLFDLYFLPDTMDLSTRVRVGRDPPYAHAATVLSQNGLMLVYTYDSVEGRESPASLPAPFQEANVTSSGSSSRGVQQDDFRASLIQYSGNKDFVLGKPVTTAVHACHIIPCERRPRDKGLPEMESMNARKNLLISIVGFGVNLYGSANGILLDAELHKYFDQYLVSVDVDSRHRVCVWKEDLVSDAVRFVNGKECVGQSSSTYAHPDLLRWHHKRCEEIHKDK